MIDVLGRCIEAVNYFGQGVIPIYRAPGADPWPRSQAEQELAASAEKELLETAFSQSGMLIEFVADVATAYAKSLTTPTQTIAPWTLARSVLESASLAIWLMDTTIAEGDRLKRSFALRYEGLVQQEKFARSIQQTSLVEDVGKRILEVERKAIKAGSKQLQDKGGKRKGIGFVMPSVTEIISKMLDREWLYRILSGAAHGHFWALNSLSFDLVGNAGGAFKTKARSGVRVHQMQKSLSPISVLGLSTEVLRALSMAIWTRFRLFGWNLSEIVTLMEISFDRIGVRNDKSRFWRI